MQTELLEPVDDSVSLALVPHANSAAIFQAYHEKAQAAASAADNIKVTDIADTTGPKMARAARLSLREIRIATEKRRREMVEGMTEETRRINSLAKRVKDFCEERESALLEAEQFVEREEAARREAAATEERRRAEAKAKAEREEAEAKVREAERKEREARAQAEAAEQRRLNEIRRAKEEAERTEAFRQAAEAEAARRAAAAPDKEKLLSFAAALKALPVPMLSAGSSHIQQDLARRLAGAVTWITAQANEI